MGYRKSYGPIPPRLGDAPEPPYTTDILIPMACTVQGLHGCTASRSGGKALAVGDDLKPGEYVYVDVEAMPWAFVVEHDAS